jgi:DNA-binding transcriptional ArsR family regulator
MNRAEQLDILALLKTLADEQRLTMVGLMSHQERTVTEMAELLKLTEPTISHHVSKLHSAGLLNLRMAGNQRFYRVNPLRMIQFQNYVKRIDELPARFDSEEADQAWIDALDWSAEDKKVLRDYTMNGRLTQMPTKEKKWIVVLRWLSTKFEHGIRYSEKQVNATLSLIHEDYATMRRNLVEYGFMRRERGGGDYWLTEDETNA